MLRIINLLVFCGTNTEMLQLPLYLFLFLLGQERAVTSIQETGQTGEHKLCGVFFSSYFKMLLQ